MATSERSAHSGSAHGHDGSPPQDDGVGMDHLTVVPTNFDAEATDRQ